MAKPRCTFTPAFKAEAVKPVTEQGYSIAEAARTLGVHDNQIRVLKQAFQDRGSSAFPGRGNLPAVEEELRRLRADNKGLRMGATC